MSYPDVAKASADTRPSAVTAMITGVLAILGGLFALFSAWVLAGYLSGPPTFASEADHVALIVLLVLFVVIALTLLTGAILMFRRRPLGQLLVIVGCALDMMVLAIVAVFGIVESTGSDGLAVDLGFGVVGLVALTLPVIVTLVLALVPQTSRYLGWRRHQGATATW